MSPSRSRTVLLYSRRDSRRSGMGPAALGSIGVPPGPVTVPPGPVMVPPGPVMVPPGPVFVPPGPVPVPVPVEDPLSPFWSPEPPPPTRPVHATVLRAATSASFATGLRSHPTDTADGVERRMDFLLLPGQYPDVPS